MKRVSHAGRAIAEVFFLAVLTVATYTACTPPPWVVTAENIAKAAFPIAGTLVSVINPALAPAVVMAETGFNVLIKTLDAYQAKQSTTNLQAAQAAFQAVDENVAQLEAAFHIKNPGTDAKIAAVIALLSQAVAEIGSQIPPAAVVATGGKLGARLRVTAHAKGLNASDITSQYNQIVAGDSRFKPL